MTNSKINYEFQVGGSLDNNAPSYVTREADIVFYNALKTGEYCYVLNSRQMGKSSLRVRAMQKLQADGIFCVFIDLTGIGKQDSPEKWYAGIIQALVSNCQLNEKINWRSWWRDRRDLLTPAQRLGQFVEEVLLVEIKARIVVFVDEIDRVLSQPFSLDDFFGLIRYFAEQSATNAKFRRLTWTFLGVATPRDLISNNVELPFNIGKAIDLEGFKLQETEPLLKGLSEAFTNPESLMIEILAWTAGQPFLTQKLCKLILQGWKQHKFQPNIPYSVFVESIARSYIIENWEVQDEPEHLKTISDRIFSNENHVCHLLGLYSQILREGYISADNCPEQRELRLSGLVIEREGQLTVHNRIYQTVFDQEWVDNSLARLRPYSQEIKNWFASNCTDDSRLLQGQRLQEVLMWSLGKSLGQDDYRFLVASQGLAKQKVESALGDVSHAHQLLASVRHQARQDIAEKPIRFRWAVTITLAVTWLVILIRSLGLLQGSSLALLDQFFRWRPLEEPDPRITVIAIDESAIATVGEWPIPDNILAKALNKLETYQPRNIGLDIFRDLPVGSGYKDLEGIFTSTLNLFAVEKVVGEIIPAPPALKQSQQIGFADQVLDSDGKVRRALLAVSPSEPDKHWRYSLAVKLILHYLEIEGLTMKEVGGERDTIVLGKAKFERMTRNDGGYVNADVGGYQILLNFRGDQDNFTTFSLNQLLNDQIPREQLQDRIILIGTTAASIKDFFFTPYSLSFNGTLQPMSGVYLHANIISQILSAAIEKRPLIRTWEKPIEYLWILCWAAIGAGISWRLRAYSTIILSTILASICLLGICYLSFLGGWWIPLFPPMLSLWGAALLSIPSSKQQDKLLFQRTLTLLLEARENYPTAGSIALEYLKQSETKENQGLIDQAR